MLGALFGKGATKPEDIVFEPISGSMDSAPAAPVVEEGLPEAGGRSASHSVALGELMERVPSVWKRSGEWVPEEMLELPAVARLDAGAERPLAFSLRALVRLRPDLFRDPGVLHKDSGVDLAMEPLRETERPLSEIPSELIEDIQEESATFADWDEDKQSGRARAKEERETNKVLRSVELPAIVPSGVAEFEDILEGRSGTESEQVPAGAARGTISNRPVNGRLKRILEAYAEGLVVNEPVGVASVAADEQERSPVAFGSGIPSGQPAAPSTSTTHKQTGAYSQAIEARSTGVVGAVAARSGSGLEALRQTRFDELGLSLSRFPEVRGFALWLGDSAMQTGELGFDTQNDSARTRVEKILESALSAHGIQDGFMSVTVHHARGGISVFGGGGCLVAVSHQGEGMPSHLRSWLCGWVSQPLRG